MTKAPLGGTGNGANPTDCGKKGTKRSVLTDGKGIHFLLPWMEQIVMIKCL
jgi:hypothetical protein